MINSLEENKEVNNLKVSKINTQNQPRFIGFENEKIIFTYYLNPS